jgi:hypothetical protein
VEESASSATQYRDVSQYVREEPLTTLAIAAAAGFFLGGGITRRVGLGMLAIVGRMVWRDIATSLIVGTLSSGDDKRRRARAGRDNGRYDNGRADIQKPG